MEYLLSIKLYRHDITDIGGGGGGGWGGGGMAGSGWDHAPLPLPHPTSLGMRLDMYVDGATVTTQNRA